MFDCQVRGFTTNLVHAKKQKLLAVGGLVKDRMPFLSPNQSMSKHEGTCITV